MPYNSPTPSQSTTLTSAERSSEARRILTLLKSEPGVDEKLTGKAKDFVRSKTLEMDWGGKLENITENQLLFLRDIWNDFA